MFLTITPNLCIERTIEIPDFGPGKVHRIAQEKVHLNAGGKGINAARVALAMGSEARALTWVGRAQRLWFERQLAVEGIPYELVEVEPDTRICTNLVHGDGGKTEVVEAGAPLSREDVEALTQAFQHALPTSELVAVCGSYPPGQPGAAIETHLASLCEAARDAGKKLLVDSKGAAFDELLKNRAGGAAMPWAIKPNNDEAAALLGYPVESTEAEIRAARDLLDFGVEAVLLSCGKRGAYLSTPEAIHFFTPPPVQEISAVGSGDSFVGAFAARYLQTGDLIEATRWSCAAGAASAASVLSAFCSREDVEALVGQVKVEKCSGIA